MEQSEALNFFSILDTFEIYASFIIKVFILWYDV